VRTKRIIGFLAAGALLAAASACGSSANGDSDGDANGLTKVNVGVVTFSENAMLFHAIEGGIFKDHGLDVTVTPAPSPTQVVAALASGHEQFGFLTNTVLINVNLQGTPMKCVSAVDGQISPTRTEHALVASPQSGITSISGLSGKKVGVVQLASINHMEARALADKAGAKDVQYVSIPFPQMPQALASGQIDAAVISSPFLETALEAGAKVLAHPNQELFPNGTMYCFGATDKYLSSNADVAKNFRDAMTESINFCKDNESECKKTLVKYQKLAPDVAQKQTLATNFNPELKVETLAEVQDMMKSQGFIDKTLDPQSLVWNP
jgi:NitT/TauT family transport system substrate-binding protein